MSQEQHQLHTKEDHPVVSGSAHESALTILDQMDAAHMLAAKAAHQHQERQGLASFSSNFGTPLQQPMIDNLGADGRVDLHGQQQQSFQNELKRLNEQLCMPSPSNALLMTGNNNSNSSSNMNTSALLQSLFDQQRSTSMHPQQPNVSGGLANSMLQTGFFQDPRVTMAQNQLISSLQIQVGDPLQSSSAMFSRDGGSRRMRGGVIEPFPEKLHRLLTEVEAAGRSDVISWVANGRAFCIHKPDKFFKEIVPLYFRQSHLSSFKRQLNLYGMELINSGPSRGGYFHELFVKDHADLCRRMRRVAVKVGGSKESDDAHARISGEQSSSQPMVAAGDMQRPANSHSGNDTGSRM